MSIEIITPAEETDLTTVQAVKEQLHIQANDKDAQISRYIKVASDIVRSLTKRKFERETVKETIPGYGSTQLILERTPIVSVDSVLFNGEALIDYSIHNADAGILYRADGWEWTANRWWGITGEPAPNTEQPLFVIQYTAGYLLPGETGRNLPYEIEDACIELVRTRLEGAAANVRNVRIGDYAATYSDGIPESIINVLSRWERIA